ncbi:MAG TPA: KH domain-containing protein [Acidimicrobiia bacterium]|nr:KH domain-containing protein [Acidimicrobiia bacterium]
MSDEHPDFDEGYDDDEDDFEDEIAGEGNRIVGGKAKAVVEYVARYLAEEPDAVDVDLEERRGEIVLLVHASPSDMGRLIGRRGRVVQALRQLTRAASTAEGVRATVDIAE